MRRDQRNKGFTMIEIIAVLVILVLIAAVGIPGVDAYIKNSEQRARMDTARTVFMAAQTALTQKYLQDSRYGESKAAAVIPKPETIWTNMTPRQQENVDWLGYYTFGLRQGAPGKDLYDLLSPYLNDKSVLSGAILLEYNRETGNALSVFYKEADDGAGFSANGLSSFTFGYNSGSYNVYNRSETALTEGEVGFYGVDSVGDPIVTAPIQPVEVMLEDYTDPMADRYGLLVANCQLPAVQRSSFVYTLTLTSANGGDEVLTLGETEGAGDIFLGDIETTLALALESPIAVTIGGRERNIVLWRDADGRGTTLHVVLDGVHPNLSIYQNYPALGIGNLSASFSASDGVNTVFADSNSEHAYFDGESGPNSYDITSVRHLNNVRYKPGAAYEQTGDVAMISSTRGALLFPPLCGAADAALLESVTTGFTGAYHGNDNRIYSLTTGNGNSRGGLFDTVASGATVEHVNLTASGGALPSEGSNTVYGTLCAGGIAAVNEGAIRDCTYIGSVKTPNDRPDGTAGDAGVGGIAGINNGTITRCFAGATVSGYDAAGGIAGRTAGSITHCEVATASKNSTVYGIPYYGARGSGTAYSYSFGSFERDNNGFVVSVLNRDGAAGGIAGVMDGTKESYVQYCVNAAKVEAGYDDAAKDGGGIIGRASCHDQGHDYITHNINAGSVFGSGTAGGIVGNLEKGGMYACYNNGYVNATYTDTTPRLVRVNEADEGAGIAGNPPNKDNVKSGGLLGYGAKSTDVDTCYSAQYCGNRDGGAFGVMEGKVRNCAFLRNYWNNTGLYRDRENREADESGGLTRMDADTLRTTDILTKLGTADNTPFAKNTGNGVGMFANPAGEPDPYLFPYLRPEGLGDKYHRTVYFPVMGEYGMIRLTDENGERVRMDVYLIQRDAPARIELSVLTNINTSPYEFEYTLSRDDMIALEEGNMVTKTDWSQFKIGQAQLPLTLSFSRRTPLEGNKDAKAISRGFDRAYTANIKWSGDYLETLVQRLNFVAELYDEQSGERYSRDEVGRGAEMVTDPDGVKLYQENVSTGNPDNPAETLKCVYADLDMNTVGSCVVKVVDDTKYAADPATATVKEIPVNRSFLWGSNVKASLYDTYTSGTRLNGLAGPGTFLVYDTNDSHPTITRYRIILSKASDAVNAAYPELNWANGMSGFTPRSQEHPAPTFHVEVYVGGVKKVTSNSIPLP